jgi:colanic acid/amylovoran biosynthesis glycosyltransferase
MSSLKILIITNTFPCKSETFIINHVAGLASKGLSITILAKRKESFNIFLSKNIEVIYFSSASRRFLSIFLIANSLLFLFSHPFLFFKILSHVFFHHDFSILQIFSIYKVLKKRTFDITHAEFGYLGNIAIALKSLKISIGSLCVSFRGEDISSHLIKNPSVYKLLPQYCNVYLPVCTAFKNTLIEQGADPSKIKIYHSSIDISKFNYTPHQFSTDKISLISAGRFVKKKGFSLALDVVNKLKRNGFNVFFELIGDGPEKTSLLNKIKENDLDDNCILPGWLEHEVLYSHFIKSDIFISTNTTSSQGDKEGIPNVLKEAMASGLLVVAFKHSGIDEIIFNEKTGFLVTENDVSNMAEIITSIFLEKKEISHITKAARILVEQEYSFEKQTEIILSIYSSLIGSRDVR